MAQAMKETGEKLVDVNTKGYKKVDGVVLSYRKGFDNSSNEELSNITQVLGINFKKFMFSNTYLKQQVKILFANVD